VAFRTDQVDLHRTFSIPQNETEDSDDLAFFLKGRGDGNLTWNDLHEKPISVVVGEAGIGKTVEFKNEVIKLLGRGKKAFFIELNQLDNPASWGLTLEPYALAYEQWQSSLEEGYFFLDAIDEARLTDHAAFKKALAIVRASLSQHLDRVRIAISSRWTDWSIDEVRNAVEEFLVFSIGAARRRTRAGSEVEFGADVPTFQTEPPSGEEQVEAFVVTLDPLTRPESQKLADARGLIDAPAFWSAIDDGQYDYMASRPLDLQWMVRLWNQNRNFGTYLDLIEGNVANRLIETNPNYVASGAVLSPDLLRKGAEELAATAVFTGHAFIATGTTSDVRTNEVHPQAVLTDWKPMEISRLLASALFDEATYGRVKFHHRSVREYLAACWVNRQLGGGLPLHRVVPLFAAAPFGEPVLISARRWTLCWLASLNVKVREWMVRHSPEMFFFDGDPEAWDALSADQALLGYVQRLKDGLRPDWRNDNSEFRRIGRRINSERIAALLADQQLPTYVKTALFPIVIQAHLTDCRDAIFSLYNSPSVSSRERRYALDAVSSIASPEQRSIVNADLLSGALTSNELISTALAAADWKCFTADELIKVFTFTSPEDSYGVGPMALAIKYDLLPTADADSAALLLEAVVSMLLPPHERRRSAQHKEFDPPPERAWLLDALSDCFERLLMVLPPALVEYPIVCLVAAERIEALRDKGFTDRDGVNRLHGLIAKHPKLRWQVGFAIARSKDIPDPTSRVTWWDIRECLVSFAAEDMPELIVRANDTDSPIEEQTVWFAVAKEIAFQYLRGSARKAALIALSAGPESESRMKVIAERRTQLVNGSQHRRSWKATARQRKLELFTQHETNREKLRADIQHIRDATHQESIVLLIRYSYRHSSRRSWVHVDYQMIAKGFGRDVADALATGLKKVWASPDTPNPADSPNGSVPWEAITALAGLNTLLADGLDIAGLNGEEAARTARLAAWEHNSPPFWFERLATTHAKEVCEALHPWICTDALSETDHHLLRGALEMALRCPATVRPMLLRPLVAMVMNGSLPRADATWAVVKALREDGLIDLNTIAELCRVELEKLIGTDGLIREFRWLRTWLEVDIQNAWTWFETHLAGLGASAGAQVEAFAKTMDDCNWIKMPADDETVEVMLRLYAMLSRHLPPSGSSASEKDRRGLGPPIEQLRGAIPTVLVQIRGVSAHNALSQLATLEKDRQTKSWLHNCILSHAALEASESVNFEPGDLRTLGSPFLTEPRNEAQLFQQVVARLEEIRKGIEEGPFSDRDLFTAGMPEKTLQLWLAARFLDTQNRRFGVHREEVVDADNRTDIQLSSRNWNICVEIKPVDAGRGYSANSLTETLRTQIVGQYLKGYNSSHGILVLFRLDGKNWDIPNGERCQPFSSLVTYLQAQASAIKDESSGVEDLIVFAFNCVDPV
jgi:hypothetical protein